MKNLLYPKCTYRVSLKGIATYDDKLILVKEQSDYWDLPGGGIEHQEEVEPAFRREIREELGVEVESFDKDKPLVLFMFDYEPERPLLFVAYKTVLASKPADSIDDIQIGFFSKEELSTINFEKHLLSHVDEISRVAFGE